MAKNTTMVQFETRNQIIGDIIRINKKLFVIENE